MPDQWEKALTYGLNSGKANLRTWWLVFNDPILNDLINRARIGNYNLKAAVDRIVQYRAQLRFVKGAYAPFISGSGSIERSRTSEGIEIFVLPPQTNPDTFNDLGGSMSWEIDFWGKIARNVESSTASYQASIEDYRDVLVVLYADVATNYVVVRTLQDRIRFAYSNVALLFVNKR